MATNTRPTETRISGISMRPQNPVQRFVHAEASSGILLVVAAVAALTWANSPWSDSYLDLWQANSPSTSISFRSPRIYATSSTTVR